MEETTRGSRKGQEVIVVQHYKLGEKLGSGGFSVVYKGLNTRSGNFVAVKRLKKKALPEDELESRVNDLRKLSHENLVQYFDLVVSEHHFNLILEYIEGGSLAQVVEKFGVFPETLVVIYIEQALKGLTYLHKSEIIHRDIKGPNILLTKDGVVKLADFGLDFVKPDAPVTDTRGSAMSGSPFWMAPEAIQMKPLPTSACDVWSVGCTIIELLTGFPPYFDCSSITALYRMVEDAHPPIPDGISTDLADFLLQCFRKDPSERATAKGLLGHKWVANALKFNGKKSWNETLERVQKYNKKQRRDSVNLSLSGINWSPIKGIQTDTQPPKNLQVTEGLDESKETSPDEKDGKEAPKENENKTYTGYSVEMLGHEIRKNLFFGYTVYKIQVTVTKPNQPNKVYLLFKTCTDFRDLDTKLRSLVSPVPEDFPKVPTLKWFGNMDPAYVQTIMIQLRTYLKETMAVPYLMDTSFMDDFLKPQPQA